MGAQLTYLNEPDTEKEFQDGGSLEASGSLFGTCGMQGWRRNMEDAHLNEPNFDKNLALYGVFDGHGGKGVSKFAAERLPGLIKATGAYKTGDYKKALEDAFLEVDVQLRKVEGRDAVRKLDQIGRKAPRPILVPKSIVQRFLRPAGPARDEDQEPEPPADAPQSDKKDAEQEEEVSAAKAANGESEAAKGDGEPSGEAVGAHEDDGDSDGDQEVEEIQLCSEEEIDLEAVEPDADEVDDEEDLVEINPAALTADATPEGQGCTAVVALVVRDPDGAASRVICANAGDSRAILSRRGAVVALSEDQKPENPQELERITKAGGYVQPDSAGGPRVQGDLNLSRAFGDLRYKIPPNLPPAEQILTAFPEVRTIPLTEEDEFMVIGCDGIWERLTNQEAVDFVRPRLMKSPKVLSSICGEICDRGLCPSMDAAAFDGHGCDNMTVTIVQLKPQISGEVDDAVRSAAAAAEKRAADEAAEDERARKRAKVEEAATPSANCVTSTPAVESV